MWPYSHLWRHDQARRMARAVTFAGTRSHVWWHEQSRVPARAVICASTSRHVCRLLRPTYCVCLNFLNEQYLTKRILTKPNLTSFYYLLNLLTEEVNNLETILFVRTNLLIYSGVCLNKSVLVTNINKIYVSYDIYNVTHLSVLGD